jgi:branched-chain amino acid transport system permease protein
MASIVGVNAALLAGLLLVPLLGGDFLAWQIGLFLLYGVAAQGVGFAWGRGGFLPLGNALFFGLGAYGAAAVLRATDGALLVNLLAMLAVASACGALAFGLAVLLFRGRIGSGPGFSLVTLALVLIAAQIAETTPALTGGFNGFSGYPPLAGLDPFGGLYYVIAALVVVVTLAFMVIDRMPAGLILRGLVAQEGRLELLGFAPQRIKGWAFAVSAFVTSLAGALYASHQGLVTPQAIGFLLSAELVIWAAVGGRFSPLGPLLGAVAIGWASATLRDTVAWWEVAVAGLFLLVVLFLPGGAFDLVARALRRLGLGTGRAPGPPLPAPASRASHAEGALALTGVTLTAGGVRILDQLSLRVAPEGILCVIGPNGAGKTTMLNAITGRLPFQAGTVFLGETPLGGLAPSRMLDHGIGRKLQVPTVFADMTVSENLQLAMLAGRMRGADALRFAPLRWQSQPLAALLADPNVPLAKALQADARHLPQGHRQLLELAMTLAPEPRLVLLDEPAAGMSPTETQLMVRLIRAYRATTGACVIVIEHDMSLVEALASEVAVLHQGRVLAQGPLEGIRADPQVAAVYAGGHK